MAQQTAKGNSAGPFDLVVIDVDKESVCDYFNYLLETPGMLTDIGTVCIDMTPFKGQLLVQQYVKHGMPDEWLVYSGQDKLDKLRASLKASTNLSMSERNGLLIVRKQK